MRESLALFSLNRLTKLEQSRAPGEDLASQRRADAEHRARLEHERLLRAEDARRHAAEAARREEAARHEAVRVAEAERVGLEAEQRARIALIEQQRAHDRQLAAIERDTERRRLRNAVAGAGAMTAALCAGAAITYFGVAVPQVELTRRQQVAAKAAYEAQIEHLKVDLERATRSADVALRAVEQAKREAAEEK